MTSCSQLLIAGDAIGDSIFHGAAEVYWKSLESLAVVDFRAV
jgi:hypothetical protein